MKGELIDLNVFIHELELLLDNKSSNKLNKAYYLMSVQVFVVDCVTYIHLMCLALSEVCELW